MRSPSPASLPETCPSPQALLGARTPWKVCSGLEGPAWPFGLHPGRDCWQGQLWSDLYF